MIYSHEIEWIILIISLFAGDLLEAEPEQMYNVSILFDLDQTPEDYEPLIKKVCSSTIIIIIIVSISC